MYEITTFTEKLAGIFYVFAQFRDASDETAEGECALDLANYAEFVSKSMDCEGSKEASHRVKVFLKRDEGRQRSVAGFHKPLRCSDELNQWDAGVDSRPSWQEGRSTSTMCMRDEPWNGGQGRNRTSDTVIFSHVLYQLSYLAPAAQF